MLKAKAYLADLAAACAALYSSAQPASPGTLPLNLPLKKKHFTSSNVPQCMAFCFMGFEVYVVIWHT